MKKINAGRGGDVLKMIKKIEKDRSVLTDQYLAPHARLEDVV